MDNQIVFYFFFLTTLLINISFIFKADWWRKFQIYTLKKEEKWAKNIPFYKKICRKGNEICKRQIWTMALPRTGNHLALVHLYSVAFFFERDEVNQNLSTTKYRSKGQKYKSHDHRSASVKL